MSQAWSPTLAQAQRDRRAERTAAGLCASCGNNPKSATTLQCEPCREYNREAGRKRNKRRRKTDRIYVKGRTLEEKQLISAEKNRGYYAACTAVGLCYTCRKAPASLEITKHGKPSGQCNACRTDRAVIYQEVGRPRYLQLKHDAFAAYGNKCECCGESDSRFLSIDHIHGGGRKHIKEIGQGIDGLYKWLKTEGYPEGFRVLCFLCNMGREVNKGTCPHQEQMNMYTADIAA